MTRCCVRACPHFKKRPGVDDTGLKCHLFPKDPETRQKWIDWVNKANIAGPIKASKQSAVCSAHFTPGSFDPMNKKLKCNALPSVAPEMTPELAFKLGVARSAEDFIRSKQLEERKAKKESAERTNDQEKESTISDKKITDNYLIQAHCNSHNVPAQPSAADTSASTIMVQEYSQYSPEPEQDSSARAAHAPDIPVQRIFVVPIIKLRETKEISDYNSSTDSCYSDPDIKSPAKSNKPPPLIFSRSVTAARTPSVSSIIPASGTLSTGTTTINNANAEGTPTSIRIQAATGASNMNVVSSTTNALISSSPVTSSVTLSTDTSNINATTRIIVGSVPVTSTSETSTPSTSCENNPEHHEKEHYEQSVRRRRKRKYYIRDLSPSDFNTPEKAKICLSFVHKQFSKYQSRIKILSQSLRRARRKMDDLETLLKDKKQNK